MYNAQNDVIGHHVIAISGARPVSAVGTLTFSEVAIHKGMPSASGFAESASMGNVTWYEYYESRWRILKQPCF